MGETFESSPGTADDGARRPTDGLHKPLAFAFAVGTGQVTVKDQRDRTESVTTFIFKGFDTGENKTCIQHSRWSNAPQQRKRKLKKREFYFTTIFSNWFKFDIFSKGEKSSIFLSRHLSHCSRKLRNRYCLKCWPLDGCLVYFVSTNSMFRSTVRWQPNSDCLAIINWILLPKAKKNKKQFLLLLSLL